MGRAAHSNPITSTRVESFPPSSSFPVLLLSLSTPLSQLVRLKVQLRHRGGSHPQLLSLASRELNAISVRISLTSNQLNSRGSNESVTFGRFLADKPAVNHYLQGEFSQKFRAPETLTRSTPVRPQDCCMRYRCKSRFDVIRLPSKPEATLLYQHYG